MAEWRRSRKDGSKKRRRPSQRGQKTSGLKSWSTKEKGELSETRVRIEVGGEGWGG